MDRRKTRSRRLRAGAYDYLTKPVDLRQFRAVIGSALGRGGGAIAPMDPASLPSEAGKPAAPRGARPAASPAPTATPAQSPALARMAGRSAAMEQVRSLVEKVARSMAPVMVSGESGTGKELVARAIHEVSVRSAQPFIAVNCSAIPEQLLEAEFFGYRKGAFTGANEDREGFFQAANGGTLFLDEIGDLPLSMQSKLLRAIQERQVRPVGAVSELPVNVRLLSATHKDLGAEVHQGHFRQDLYYRLNVIQIRVPPLRERLGDLPDITERVLERIGREAGAPSVSTLTPPALAHLARYPFPGNVRELENLLHRAVALSASERIGVEDLGLPEMVFTSSFAPDLDPVAPASGDEELIAPDRRGPAAGRPERTASGGHRQPPRRHRTRHPGACARAAQVQPNCGRGQPGPVAATDALPHGTFGRDRGRRFRQRAAVSAPRPQSPAPGEPSAKAARRPAAEAMKRTIRSRPPATRPAAKSTLELWLVEYRTAMRVTQLRASTCRGRSEPGRDSFDQPATWRIWRRRD